MTMNDINPEKVAARTIGLALECSRFGDERRGDLEKVTTDADKGLLGLKKRLVPRVRGAHKADIPPAAQKAADALRALDMHDRTTQRYIRSIGLPSYFKAGTHRIPLAMVGEMQEYLTTRRDERKPLEDAFVAAYPELIDAMEVPLGSQYRREDFPSVQDVRDGFGFDWRWMELDGVPTRVADVSQAAYDQAQKAIKRTMRKVAEGVRLAMRSYLMEIVKEVRGKLASEADGEPKKFRQSTILGDLTEFFRTFPLRNVTDDHDLQRIVGDLHKLTEGLDLDEVKTDAGLQAGLAKQLDASIAALTPLLIEKGARTIVLEDEMAL